RELYKSQQQLQQIRQTPPATVREEIEYHGKNEPTQTSDTTKIELSDETHLSCDRHYNQPVYVDKTLSITELFTPSGMGRTLSKDIAKGPERSSNSVKKFQVNEYYNHSPVLITKFTESLKDLAMSCKEGRARTEDKACS
ncbi:hypothetical protein PV326_001466, partial [Microctonus aethiopoides]